jgi:pimeloyl-ACP methyl ester carboxylesterase
MHAPDLVKHGTTGLRAWPGRAWRLSCAGLLFVMVTGFVMTGGCGRAFGPRVVAAPNQGKALAEIGDPTEEQLRQRGIDRHLRVEVGPPVASLSLSIFEPRHGAISINLANRWLYTFNQEDRPSRQDEQPLGTVLVLHGIYDKTEGYNGEWGRIFAAAGYRAILVDLRGHGRSTGDFMTYGVVESRDISQVIDFLEEQNLIAGQLGVFGISYGGAVAIQAAAIDNRIAAVNTVASFSSLPEVVPPFGRRLITNRAGELGWLLLRGAIPEALRTAGRTANFDPADASPRRAIGHIRAPILLVHGTADAHVPQEHALALHAASPEHSRLVLIERGTHLSLPLQRLGQMRKLALDFFDETLTPTMPILADKGRSETTADLVPATAHGRHN